MPYIAPYDYDDFKILYEQTQNPQFIVHALALDSHPPYWVINAWVKIGKDIAAGKNPLKKKQGRPKLNSIPQNDWGRLLEIMKELKQGNTKHNALKSESPEKRTELYRLLKKYEKQILRELEEQNRLLGTPRIQPEQLIKTGEYVRTQEMDESLELLLDLNIIIEELLKREGIELSSIALCNIDFLDALYQSLILKIAPPKDFDDWNLSLKDRGMTIEKVEQLISNEKTRQNAIKKTIGALKEKYNPKVEHAN
jgi:hypothetical protein